MKLSKKLEKALNKQVAMEYEAAYKYNGMRIYLDDFGVPGATHWMTLQTKEEIQHAEDFIQFIKSLDGQVELAGIQAETTKYDGIASVWEAGLAHEKEITKSIEEILALAIKEKNYAAENFLRTYVDEQVEEEENFRDVLQLFELAGKDKAAMFQVDSYLGQRGQE